MPVATGPFAELLLRYRLSSGLSQRELADRAGLSERAVRDLERGTTQRPRWHSVRAVASALDLAGDNLAALYAAARGSARTVPARAAAAVAEPLAMSSDLVGRADELRVLADLVVGGRHRLITVTGPGGVGKSRLVAELVTALGERTSLDISTLELSALGDPSLVGELIAEALGCGGESQLAPVARIAAHLRDRRAVLVLDCVERLVAAAAEIVLLVRRCPGLTVLVTSQRPLRVRGERELPLDPLPLRAAVDLFVRRATTASPIFALTADNTAAVEAICRAVDGLPLAVELAAARMGMLSPDELAGRLDQRLRVLVGGARDVPDRHRSLRATIESSLEVVTEPARTVFTWLGAFAGGGLLTDIATAAATLGHDDDWLLAALTELVDMSLVRVSVEATASRYALPDAMAELAVEWLGTRPDRERVARAVATSYLSRFVAWSSDPARYNCALIQRDPANVRAAVAWAIRHDPAQFDVPVLDALSRYFELAGRYAEGEATLVRVADAGRPLARVHAGRIALLRGDLVLAGALGDRALAEMDPADHAGRAWAHLHRGTVASERHEWPEARRHLRTALIEARRAADLRLTARVLNNLGTLSGMAGRPRDAERLFYASLEAKRRSGAGPLDRGSTLYNLAELARDRGRFELSASRAAEAAALLESGGFSRWAAMAASSRALALVWAGDPAGAMEAATYAMRLVGDPGDDWRAAAAVDLRRSVVLHAVGDRQAAVDLLRQTLPVAFAHDHRTRQEVGFTVAAHAVLAADRIPGIAAALFGAAERLLALADYTLQAVGAGLVDNAVATCRAVLGDQRYEQERQYGAGLDEPALVELCALIVPD